MLKIKKKQIKKNNYKQKNRLGSSMLTRQTDRSGYDTGMT